jgi:hypothetical protein
MKSCSMIGATGAETDSVAARFADRAARLTAAAEWPSLPIFGAVPAREASSKKKPNPGAGPCIGRVATMRLAPLSAPC